MMMGICSLAQLVLSGWALTAATSPDDFFYHNFLGGKDNEESMHMFNDHVFHPAHIF